MKLQIDHFLNHRADRFFSFLAGHGVSWFYIDGQPRKQNNERGAPVGPILGFKFGVHVSKVLPQFLEFIERCENRKKFKVDLVTRESPARAGAKLILADDLQEYQLYELRLWWHGAMAWLETSAGNYQAILVSPRYLERDEVSAFSRYLHLRFGADSGAATADRLHRFPGSPNFKRNGAPFFCKLTGLIEQDCNPEWAMLALEEALHELQEEKDGTPVADNRNRALDPSGLNVRMKSDGLDNSGQAFGMAIGELLVGTAEGEILASLASSRWIRHHDPQDWPNRTLHNAKFALGWVPNRYKAGSSRA